MENTKTNSSGQFVILLFAFILVIAAFVGGYFVRDNDVFKTEKKEENEVIETTETTSKTVPTMDQFAINGYGDEIKFYMIDNGSVYYMYGNYATRDILLTHSSCLYDGSGDYCKGNPTYTKKATKVEGLSNVVRLKVYNSCFTTGEGFDVFAITEDGNIYRIVANTAMKVFGDNNVDDMLTQTYQDGNYVTEVLLKDGTKTKYICSNTGDVA